MSAGSSQSCRADASIVPTVQPVSKHSVPVSPRHSLTSTAGIGRILPLRQSLRDQSLAHRRTDCREHRVSIAEKRPQCPILRMQVRQRALRSGRRLIKVLARLILTLLLLQRQQAAKQTAAVAELIRIEIAVEQTHQAALFILREDSVAMR